MADLFNIDVATNKLDGAAPKATRNRLVKCH